MGSRPKKFAALLFKLLLHPLMQRATSEILISHGSEQAWQARANLTGAARALADRFDRRRGFEGASRAGPEVFCDTEHQLRLANFEGNRLVHTGKKVHGSSAAVTPGARADTSKLRHFDSRVANAELGAAQRFLAAGHARNEAIVHVDEDILADAHNLELISRTFCQLHAEPGFPTYSDGSPPGLYGPTARYCGLMGYGSPLRVGGIGREMVVLTNLAASSRALVDRFIKVLDQRYRLLMRNTRGDGEDIVFADAARRAGASLRGLTGTDSTGGPLYMYGVHTEPPREGSYVTRRGHYELRHEICCCLSDYNVTTRVAPAVSTHRRQIIYPQLLSDDDGTHQQIWTPTTHPTRRSMGTRLAACVSAGSCRKDYKASPRWLASMAYNKAEKAEKAAKTVRDPQARKVAIATKASVVAKWRLEILQRAAAA